MSLRAMLAVFEHSRSTLAARLVLLALADYAHDDGTKAFPSIATLAAKANVSERSVQYALRKLEQDGEIVNAGKTKGGTTIWNVTAGGAKSAPPGVQSLQSGGAKSAPDPSREPPTSKTSKPRARNPMFDELALACGLNLDAMTKEASRLCGIAAGEISKAGGTPDMVKLAVRNYRAKFVGAAATPKAIANHWPEIVPSVTASMRAQQVCVECGIGGGYHIDDCSLALRPTADLG